MTVYLSRRKNRGLYYCGVGFDPSISEKAGILLESSQAHAGLPDSDRNQDG
jgi:hypothetical protein